ncbi:MAG TPA: DUF6777 domain-containing protein [Acidimicrobiales bacterium]|nr:DUF6777 domain-containing protein [Acidimicrobiales bacterium]
MSADVPSGPPTGPPPGPTTGQQFSPPATPPVAPSANPAPSAPGTSRPPRGFEWFNTVTGRQTLLVIGVAIALVIGLVIAGSNSSGGSTTPKGEIFLDAANSPGTNAFTPSVAKAFAVGEATTTTVPQPAAPAPGAVSSVPGGTVGLYGGTLNLSSCNAQQMVNYLLANPALGQAWAAAEGIPYSGLSTYILSLTPVILRGDTQVTNHGYYNGYANPIPEILQAGTAVLIDAYGVPRARCYCGNPLTPPVPTTVTPTYVGPRWPTFSPTTVVVVVAAPAPIPSFTLVDTNTGQTFTRPAGTSGRSDSPGTSSSSTSSTTTTTTTTTVPPGLTGSGTIYSLTLSNPQVSGNTVYNNDVLTPSDCNIFAQNMAGSNTTVLTSGSSIGMKFANGEMTGSYDPSSGSFSVTTTESASNGPNNELKFTGTLSPQAISGGQFVVTITPPGGICSFTATGQRVLTP